MLQRHARTAERVGAFAPFSVPHFGKIYMGGMLWSVCRWGLGFLGAYFVNQRTHSPRLVQLTGTMMWAPLLFAGLIGGSLADRFDRRRIVLAQFSTLMPLVGLIGFASLTNHLEVWMIFPFQICIGVGWVIDMTARRALVYDLVGDQHVNGAMALEQFASSLGLAGGALAGGSIIGGLGIAWAYIAVAACMSVALLVLARLPAGISQQSAPRAAAVVRPTLRST